MLAAAAAAAAWLPCGVMQKMVVIDRKSSEC
jgi:hypothetical protein